jgi:hypothetical protein
MIIKDTETTIEQIGNIQDEAQFKMRTSQKAFQILSSLYSDKPLAIVRELGCNAMDSHIASGQPNRPFHIHAPNSLEPWILIQDFGTGISHENIYEIYSTYFASTKTNTNTQVGMLGLGSKSPFCYTDNFTITSIHNQVKRIYNAYFNAQGMPTIALASQEQTKDENGVAIQIPIKVKDIGDFNHAIWKAFRFFKTKPTISGHDINWNLNKPDFEGTFWQSYHNQHNECVAIMGGVAYPIDIYKLDNDHYDIARKAGLVMNFNIGELDVTPSREALMYHDWVVAALNEKITLVKKDFVTKVEDQIKNSDNLLDALKALYLLNNQWSFLNSTLIKGKVKWKNVEITEPRKSIKQICQNNLTSYSKRVWGRAKWSESEYASLDNSSLWYYTDLKAGNIKRVINFVKTHADQNVSVNLVNQQGMKDLIASGFPASIFKPASTLPAVTATRGIVGGTSRPKGVITLYDMGYQYRQSWEGKSFDLTNGVTPKYYVVKSKDNWEAVAGTLKDSNGKAIVTPTQKGTLSEVLSFLGINTNDVRMVAQGNTKFLDALGSKNLADVINAKKISIDIEKVKVVKAIDNHMVRSLVKDKKFQTLSDENAFKKMILDWHSTMKDVNKIEPLIKFIRTDEKYVLTFPSKMVEMMYHACGSWQCGISKVVDALLEQEQIS